MFPAHVTQSPRPRSAPHRADAERSPALHRAAGLAGWTLVVGCLVWRGPFRFVLGTVGAGLLMHGAARPHTAAPSDARHTAH